MDHERNPPTPKESVSKMLGHSNLAMTKKYARILNSTIGQEMNQLAEKLQFHMN
jgi:site-specific recombinase XerD